jgi:hypothetical protein
MQTSLIACRAQAAERPFGHIADVFDPVGRFRVGDLFEAAEALRRRTRTQYGKDKIDPAKRAYGQTRVILVASKG